MGARRRSALAILYLLGAYAAAGGAISRRSARRLAPMVGASGAISAVLGAYAVLFGKNKVKVAAARLALALNALVAARRLGGAAA